MKICRLSGIALRTGAEHESHLHAHPGGQFSYVSRGLVRLQTEAGIWVVPEGRLAWIPPGVSHASRSRGPVEGWLVLAPPAYASYLPDRVSVLKASPLLVAALGRIVAPGEGDEALQNLLNDLVLIEIRKTGAETLGIPLPSSPALRKWAGSFLAAPDIKVAIDAAAAAAHMSRRSFTRHFTHETGTTFSAWKRLVLVQQAIERLADGLGVAEVAYALGYENPSAFIAMFKAVRGTSPRRFMAGIGGTGDRRDGAGRNTGYDAGGDPAEH